MATTYWDYIRVEDLLALQGGIDDDETPLSNHEVLFITVHQVFELWFKLVIRELLSLRRVFAADPVPEDEMARAARGLDRVSRILQVANQHWAVMESLSTRDFLDFRDKLYPASGFQSAQLREVEILLGLEAEQRVGLGTTEEVLRSLRTLDRDRSRALERVEARMADAREHGTLKQGLFAWLARAPIQGSVPTDADDPDVVERFAHAYVDGWKAWSAATEPERVALQPTEERRDQLRERIRSEAYAAESWIVAGNPAQRRIHAALLFIESYRHLPLLSGPREVLERVVETEQAFLVFRQRHARMVERIIGRRIGTGGTSGVAYLDETALRYRVFEELWQARTYLVPREYLPALENEPYYDFRTAH